MKAKLVSQPKPERVILGEHLPLKTPFVVYIEPSGFCNLKCVFCPQSGRDKRLVKDVMSFKLWQKVIDDLGEFNEKIKLLRVCGNGEPLMNNNLVKILEYAHGKVDRIELISNGTILNDFLIENLPKYADRIIISIEGLSGKEYKKISGVKVDFRKLTNNVRKLHANSGDCVIHVKIHHEAVKNKKEKFFKIFGGICDEIYIENIINMWPEFESKYANKNFRYGGNFTEKNVCVQMFKGFQIQANGEVVPCCVDWRRVNIIGDVRNESVKEVWEGKRLKALRMIHLKGGRDNLMPCNDCTMNDLNDTDNIDDYAKEILNKL